MKKSNTEKNKTTTSPVNEQKEYLVPKEDSFLPPDDDSAGVKYETRKRKSKT